MSLRHLGTQNLGQALGRLPSGKMASRMLFLESSISTASTLIVIPDRALVSKGTAGCKLKHIRRMVMQARCSVAGSFLGKNSGTRQKNHPVSCCQKWEGSEEKNEERRNPQPAGRKCRYAVLGAGFAGIATTWHLLQRTRKDAPVCVTVFDEVGVGGGASGVSGGLLHPFSPKGKLLWKAREGWEAALELISIAEAKAEELGSAGGGSDPNQSDSLGSSRPIVWRRGVLRPALTEKHAKDFKQNAFPAEDRASFARWLEAVSRGEVGESSSGSVSTLSPELPAWVGSDVARELLPGLLPPPGGNALYIPQGINVHPGRYLQALWRACCDFSQSADAGQFPGTAVAFQRRSIASLSELDPEGYDAVIVCLGAGAMALPEVRGRISAKLSKSRVLELSLPPPTLPHHHQQQQILQQLHTHNTNQHSRTSNNPKDSETLDQISAQSDDQRLTESDDQKLTESHGRYHPVKVAPCLSGATWVVAQDSRRLLVGATKEERVGVEDVRSRGVCEEASEEEGRRASAELLSKLEDLLELPTSDDGGWRVTGVKAGVRMIPDRCSLGTVPFVGRLERPKMEGGGAKLRDHGEQGCDPKNRGDGRREEEVGEAVGVMGDKIRDLNKCRMTEQKESAWWLNVGFGSRGLMYHAWLGKVVAQAVVENNEAMLMPELLSWKQRNERGSKKGKRVED